MLHMIAEARPEIANDVNNVIEKIRVKENAGIISPDQVELNLKKAREQRSSNTESKESKNDDWFSSVFNSIADMFPSSSPRTADSKDNSEAAPLLAESENKKNR